MFTTKITVLAHHNLRIRNQRLWSCLYRRLSPNGVQELWQGGAAKRFNGQLAGVTLELESSDSPIAPAYDTARVGTHQPFKIRTLDPHKLRPSDYLDLSDGRALIVEGKSDSRTKDDLETPPYISYWRRVINRGQHPRRRITYLPFPVGTRGFFYLDRHPRIPMASSLRFRLVSDAHGGLQAFAKGQDLLTEFGTPWQIPLIAIAKSERYALIRDVLLLDGSASSELLEQCVDLTRRAPRLRVGPWSQLVFEMYKPFYLDLQQKEQPIIIVGVDSLLSMRLDGQELTQHMYPFASGRLLCQFEHARNKFGHRSFNLRVLRIIEPVKMVNDYSGPVAMPLPGAHLPSHSGGKSPSLRQRGLGEAKYTFWKRYEEKQEWHKEKANRNMVFNFNRLAGRRS